MTIYLKRVPNISWNYVQCTLCFCKLFCQTMWKIRAFCIPYMYLLRTKSCSMYLKTKNQIRMTNVHFLDLLHIEYGVNINRNMPFSHIFKMAAVYKRHFVQVRMIVPCLTGPGYAVPSYFYWFKYVRSTCILRTNSDTSISLCLLNKFHYGVATYHYPQYVPMVHMAYFVRILSSCYTNFVPST